MSKSHLMPLVRLARLALRNREAERRLVSFRGGEACALTLWSFAKIKFKYPPCLDGRCMDASRLSTIPLCESAFSSYDQAEFFSLPMPSTHGKTHFEVFAQAEGVFRESRRIRVTKDILCRLMEAVEGDILDIVLQEDPNMPIKIASDEKGSSGFLATVRQR